MGYYVNPDPPLSKEAWLQGNATEYPSAAEASRAAGPDARVVCLVDNGRFTAAGVCYSKGELEAFANTQGDPRPKRWFVAPVKALRTVTPSDTPWI